MAGKPLTHDIRHWTITVGGIMITDFGETDAVKLSHNSDKVEFTPSCGRGPGMRSVMTDDSGTLTITLSPGSAQNAAMSAFAKLDMTTGAGAAPVAVIDLNGGTFARSPSAWVKTLPDIELGKTAGEMVWVLEGNWDTEYAGKAY